MKILDITSLEQAIKTLRESLERLKRDDESFIKDSVIKRFEYTYELCHRLFKRYLEVASPGVTDLDGMVFQTLVRTANEMGMFKGDWSKWKKYRDARNITSHTYSEEKADQVVRVAYEFYDEAEYFLNKRKEKLTEMH